MQFLKRLYRYFKYKISLFTLFFRKFRVVRYFQTKFLKSGLIAIGERNDYPIPSKWITVDWRNADYVLNLQESPALPFKNDSQDVIYSSHMVEHIPQASFKSLLRECYRILKPGGHIRIETPDSERIVNEYVRGNAGFFGKVLASNMEILIDRHGYGEEYGTRHIVMLGLISCYVHPVKKTHIPVLADKSTIDEKVSRLSLEEFCEWAISLQSKEQLLTGGHINAHNFSKMKRALEDAGFGDVKRMETGKTKISKTDFNGIERESRGYYSLIVEAEKA